MQLGTLLEYLKVCEIITEDALVSFQIFSDGSGQILSGTDDVMKEFSVKEDDLSHAILDFLVAQILANEEEG